MTDFEEYIRESEPNNRQKAYAWRTAIGLQAVDGLKPSEYLKDTARKHIEDIMPAQANGFVTLLYPDNPRHPRQKYVLTVKGLALFSSMGKQ